MMEKYGKVNHEIYEVVDKETKEVKATTDNMQDALEALEKNANCEIEVKE